MTQQAFYGSKDDEVNIYLDLTKIYSILYDKNVVIPHPLSIAAVTINLCAHLRSYYIQYHRVNTNFFLIYSNMTNSYNSNLIPRYNDTYLGVLDANKVKTDAINIALDALTLLCPYLPNIYFKRDIYEPMVVMYHIMMTELSNGNSHSNIIITKDPLLYQLPAMRVGTAIYRDNKMSDTFSVVTNATVIQSYLCDTGRRNLLDDDIMRHKVECLSPQLLSLIMTLSNIPSRCVKPIYDINKAINMIYDLISKGVLYNNHMIDSNYLYTTIFNGLSKISLETFTLRYRAIDLLLNYDYYINTPYAKDMSYKQDLNDPQSVQNINNMYFKDTPIDLNRL